ncbi:MAG: AraC family transcriptional regulator [Prevotella sp.]|nr:AraC family transcriptional regulator [Prevotella sp.]
MGRTTRHIILLLFATLFIYKGTGYVYAQGANNDQLTGSLWEQCERARSLCHYDTLQALSSRLLETARKDNNGRDEAYALFYQGLAQLFTGKKTEALHSLNEAGERAEEIENDSILALVMNTMGIFHAMTENNNYVAQRYFFKSLEYAEKAHYEQVKGRIYGNLLILTHADNDTTGLDNAVKIYEYGKKNGDFEQTFMGAYYLAMYYNLKGENTRSEQYLEESLSLYDRYHYDDVASVYTLYSKVKADMGDLTTASVHAQKAIELAQRYHQAMLLPDAFLQYAMVLHEMGDYVRSNDVAHQALAAAEQSSSRTKSVACYELIAKNCQRLGQKDLAMEYMERANRAMDTLSSINMERLRHEQTILNDINQKEQEALVRKQQMADQRKLNLLLIVTSLILASLLAVIWANYRRRNRLYKNIVRQNAHAVLQHDEMQQRINKLEEVNAQLTIHHTQSPNPKEPLTIEDDSTQSSEMPTDSTTLDDTPIRSGSMVDDERRAQDLYQRACQLMEKERLFTDPQLNRERFAELLGTNRTYLSKILKEKSGMTYVQFVNTYRIDEAIRQLSDPTLGQSPLKQIWSDLGFNSPVTFYKQFQQAVGITPSVYRKQFLAMREEAPLLSPDGEDSEG